MSHIWLSSWRGQRPQIGYFQIPLRWEIYAKNTFHAMANGHSVFGAVVERVKTTSLPEMCVLWVLTTLHELH